MHRSPYSIQDNHHDHLRTLIDQRNARADVHGRLSSMSQYSDTPSVYSHAYFSPRPSDGSELYGGHPYSTEVQSARTPRHDQQASMLDLDDDPRTSYAPSDTYEETNESYDEIGDGEESVARMSYLGPKMRFHSRAPWEEDALMEEDEQEDQRHFPVGFPFSRKNTAKSVTSGSSSPRPSFNAPSVTRPSVESSQSRLSTKRSFETISSQMSYPQGALYTLAQESMSASSLARPPPPPALHKEGKLSKFSLGRLRTDTTSMSSLSPSPLASPAVIRKSTANYPAPRPAVVTTNSLRSSSTDSFEYSSPTKGSAVHPYANPDLVASFVAEPDTDESSLQPSNTPRRCDSNLTVTESYSSDSMARTSTRTTLTSETSVNSVSVMSRLRLPSLGQKGGSVAPLVIGTPKPLPQGNPGTPISSSPPHNSNLAGWAERSPAAAPFSLISLEEARAQKMRSSTANGTTLSESVAPFPGAGSETTIAGIEASSSTLSNLTSRARGRSISAGSKAKNMFQNKGGAPRMERRESEPVIAEHQLPMGPPPGKTLKNKKSGFLRLFNKEKEGQDSPPPVPTLPESVNPPQLHSQRTIRAIQRVPVPSISPSLQVFDTPSGASNEAIQADVHSPTSKSPKRTPPPVLTLSNLSQGAQSRASTAERPYNYLDRPFVEQFPQSAPANVSEFPVLKLRPVSTLFSTQFGDHIVPGGTPRSSEDTDLSTPRSPSPSGLISPITPISMTRPSQDQARIAYAYSHTPDDPSAVRALQEQMVSQKKTWQSRIWELESQVRDLKAELEDVKGRNADSDEQCDRCGRGRKLQVPSGGGVVNRPRARTGTSSRFGNPLP